MSKMVEVDDYWIDPDRYIAAWENRGSTSILNDAIDYASRKWEVFPADSDGLKKSHKSAEHSNGRNWGKTTDPDEIRRDFQRWIDANIGIATGLDSGIFVIEADTPKGHDVDGIASLRKLEAEHGALPDTLMAESPSGSVHRYFKWPFGVTIRNSMSKIAPGVDVRGEGGMVIAPPSLRPGKGYYRWLNEGTPVAEAPQWLIELATANDVETRTPGENPEADPALVAAAFTVISNPDLNWEEWNKKGMAIWAATGGSGFAVFDNWSKKSIKKYNARETAERWNHYFKSPPDQIGAGSIIEWANQASPEWRYDYDAKIEEAVAEANRAAPSEPGLERVSPVAATPVPLWRSALPLIDISNWDHEPVPPQEWAVPDRVPLRNTTLFSGEGAAGKSLIQLQSSVAHVLGRDWLGTTPVKGPALFIDAEDEVNVIHKRLADILKYYGVNFADVKDNLHLVSLAGNDAVMAALGRRSGRIEPTPLYTRLLEMVGDIKPKMIGIASSADVFAGNEIDRSQVKQFVAMLTRLAMLANGGIILISHPSLTGINTGTGLSGTTQWHNSVRARFYLESVKSQRDDAQPDTNIRKLVFKKNNYGPMSESIGLQYKDGLFLPVEGTTLDATAKIEIAKDVFLTILKRFFRENRKASANRGPGYAPPLFAEEQEAKDAGCTKETLATAMRFLLKGGHVVQESYGRASNPHYRLVISETM